MNEGKLLSFLGLAKKAGKIVFGKEMIRSYLRENIRNKVLVIASDASNSIKADWKKRCQSHDAVYIVLKNTSKLDLARAIGLGNISAVGVMDDRIAAEIIKLVRSGGEENAKNQSL
ncbi:50S ribosomal protein L7 [Kosmotoga arenicorallina S304]|uniref:50S ribosomal protein L7 n=1 Tax=Kosmotoga arenicorallina S304 TaxID=1453497 RepID=A0A176K1V0_9BACT|nr:50S ribosomal protein L7 [Kosmotoga arenicorallina S304]